MTRLILKNILCVWLCFFCVGLGLAFPAYAQQGAQHFEGFNLQGLTDSGEKSWDIKGDTAQIEGSTVKIENVNANHYGEQEVNLTADKGQLDKDSGNVHLEDNVVITQKKDGGQLKTDYLDWDKNKDIVKTDAPVTITDPKQGLITTGKGLEAKPNLKVAQINEDVTLNVESKKPDVRKITITSDGPMKIDQKANKATFEKNVVAVDMDRTLKADLMEVFFDPVTNKIKEAICTGNVVIIQGGNTTHSEKAIYNGLDQTLTLVGRPKLILETQGEGSMPSLKKK